MNETSKSAASRERNRDYQYLRGKILDVGAGNDLLKLPAGVAGTVTVLEKQRGEAGLLKTVPSNTYDAVYASHCLTQARDVPLILTEWSRVTKPGGAVFIVTPEVVFSVAKTQARFSFVDHTERPSGPFYMIRDLIKAGAVADLFLVDARMEFNEHGKNWDKAEAELVLIFRKIV